jgi:hypothetical protein
MGDMRRPVPADAGRRLIPAVIDELAVEEPDRVIYEFARGTRVADGMTKLPMKDYANSINRAAWWLEKELGKSTNFEPLGYIGPGDLRYFILAVAALKTGYIVSGRALFNEIGSLQHQTDVVSLT